MVHITDIAAAFSLASGLLGLGLLTYSFTGYRRTGDGRLGFVTGAFTVFTLKSLFVAYSIWTDLVAHEALELIDAVGDMATIGLFALPLVAPRRAA